MMEEHKEEDFSDQDLRGQDLSRKVFLRCNFDRANMSFVDCTGSSFVGSSFRQTICHHTNFKDAKLGATIFHPSDCFGMTITLSCHTFMNMHVSQTWWFYWLTMLSIMKPDEKGPVKEPLKDKLVALIGAVRYVKLSELFARRDI